MWRTWAQALQSTCFAVTQKVETLYAASQPVVLPAHAAGPAMRALRTEAMTVLPGVGELTALVILAEVGDIDRFGSARKLAAWAGLTPTVRGSDQKVRHGHISKQGSTWLRWIMWEAAQTAKRSPEFATSYQAIAHRRGKKIATTAIARKLLTRAYHLLRDASATTGTTGTTGTASRTTSMPDHDLKELHLPGELVTPHEPASPRSLT